MDYIAILYKCETYKVLIIYNTVLVRISMAVIKYSDQNYFGYEWFIRPIVPQSSISSKDKKTGT